MRMYSVSKIVTENGKLDNPIPYAVAATLEVGQGVAVPVYERVRERLREIVRIRT